LPAHHAEWYAVLDRVQTNRRGKSRVGWAAAGQQPDAGAGRPTSRFDVDDQAIARLRLVCGADAKSASA
jgi:hypothetical protein